jgi:hypothetical protein
MYRDVSLTMYLNYRCPQFHNSEQIKRWLRPEVMMKNTIGQA